MLENQRKKSEDQTELDVNRNGKNQNGIIGKEIEEPSKLK